MADSNIIANVDTAVGQFFSQWNFWTTILVAGLLGLVIYPLFVGAEPDIHPFLIARQAQASPIRQPGESSTYRTSDLPYGYPLRAGLGVKDPGAPKWSSGRDGDLRDVWRQAVKGPLKDDGTYPGPPARITTILGKDHVIEHDLKELTLDINVIGKYLQGAGSKKVVVCLSNSVELLCTIIAGAFYSFHITLVPYGQKPKDSVPLLSKVDADTLVAEAGSVAVELLLSKNKSIRRIIWVAKAGNKHLDWNEVPEGIGGNVDVTTWQDLIDEKKAGVSSEPLPVDKETKTLPVATFCHGRDDHLELVEYSSENLIAATSAVIHGLPRNYRLSPSDVVLSTVPLTESFALAWMFATLFSNATIALNSVAGDHVSIQAASHSSKVHPTIVLVTSGSVTPFLAELENAAGSAGLFSGITNYFNQKTLAEGRMSASKPAFFLNFAPSLTNLRALYIQNRSGAPKAARIRSSWLARLRLLTGARVAQALTDAHVAGAIAQSNILDYRDKDDKVNVGAPLGSVEVHLTGPEDEMAKTDGIGKLSVKGPAVVGDGKTKKTLHIHAAVDADHTLSLS